jgi:hypothetical protein
MLTALPALWPSSVSEPTHSLPIPLEEAGEVAVPRAHRPVKATEGRASPGGAIDGGKSRHDWIDSFKIATVLRGGALPQTYFYPRQTQASRPPEL